MLTRVISIGALAANPMWDERSPVRTGHATTTLIISGKSKVLIDPGLPTQALTARLAERANLSPADITDIFLTSFHPEARRALPAFEKANWLIGPAERERVGGMLAAQLKRIVSDTRGDDPQQQTVIEAIRQEVAILQRCQPAPDRIADRVGLFPLPGVSPGLCGLILEGERFTTVICGDAIPTQEHLEQGKVLPTAADVDQAKESFQDAVEVADLLILGRDNMVVNPTKRPF